MNMNCNMQSNYCSDHHQSTICTNVRQTKLKAWEKVFSIIGKGGEKEQ